MADKKAAKPKGKSKGKSAAKSPERKGNSRVAANVRRAKGWAGLGGFLIAAFLSHQANTPFVVMGMRALVAGILSYMVIWAVAVTIWRYVLMAEMYGAAEKMRADRADDADQTAAA